MEPVTIGTVAGILALARLALQEWRWHRSQERAGKKYLKAKKKEAKRAAKKLAKGDPVALEVYRRKAGLADEGGGSRLGHEARKEYDATGGNEWEKEFHKKHPRKP